jgi:short-subunit dehydrogenase
MRLSLKPLDEQVLVITGASSGIGLVTARMAARHGATLVLAARSEHALNQLADELAADGRPRPEVVVADVGNEADVRRIAAAALARFGRFDTWVNDAGISTYGRIVDIPIADHRRLFETNFWGLVYGSLVAVEHLKTRGGALINLGSVVSDVPIAYQSMYSASKHAVKGFTDGLRMELEADGYPVSVTLIKPTGINTPYIKHAKNYLREEDSLPPPVYAPETVARAILHAATHPIRDVYIGSGAKLMATQYRYTPRLFDKFMELAGRRMQTYRRPSRPREQNALDQPSDNFVALQERGDPEMFTREHSLYTTAALRPKTSAAVVLGAAALAGLGIYATATRED